MHAHPFTDATTGLNYVRARWYDSSTGTWLSPDPAGYRDSSNLYSFAGGDPINGRDPLGLITLREATANGSLNAKDWAEIELTNEEIRTIVNSAAEKKSTGFWAVNIVPKDPDKDPEGALKQAKAILLLRMKSFQLYVGQLYELTRGMNPYQFAFETGYAIGSGEEPVMGTKVDRGDKLVELVTYLAFMKGGQWVSGKLAQVRATAMGKGPHETMSARWESLEKRRTSQGQAPAGTPADEATFARLEIDGAAFDGVNSGIQNPKTKITLERVNAQTKLHAEGEAVQKAIDAGKYGKAQVAEMWVDRPPCTSCGPKGGLRSLARNLGVKRLIVHYPGGHIVVTPTP